MMHIKLDIKKPFMRKLWRMTLKFKHLFDVFLSIKNPHKILLKCNFA